MSEITNSQIERLISLERINNNQATQIGAQQKHIDVLVAENTKLKKDLEEGTKEVMFVQETTRRKCYSCGYTWSTDTGYCPNCGSYVAKPNMTDLSKLVYKNIEDESLREIIQTNEYKNLSNKKKDLEKTIEALEDTIEKLNKDLRKETTKYTESLKEQEDKEQKRVNGLREDYEEQIKKLNLEIEDLKLNIVDELTEKERKDELTDLKTTIKFLQKQIDRLLTMPLFKLLFYRRSTQATIRESWEDVNEKITIARATPHESEDPADFLRHTWFGKFCDAGVDYLKRRRRAKQNTPKTSNKAK